ncbi:hypothetical protein [Alcanivorax sp.]|uniref:hypothetical protein n=1 Tax=Alcanivorax sp. TaxID=1872427 RepID=UPI0025C488C1|nr:hypothetical protein [Alcanivorax sp.]|tara:strand:+ start:8542 stop:9594 length:1053 start_codon:yes stop_codon:yes gene_type:complete
MKNEVVVVGAIPRPIGGVSEFVYRLVCRDGGEVISRVIDPYFSDSKKKLPEGVVHSVGPKGKLRFAWLWLVLAFSSARVMHINFSSAFSVLLLFVFPKRRRAKWILTLHNGNLRKVWILPLWVHRIAFRRFDLCISLSESQYDFYRKLGVDKSKIRNGSSYIFFRESAEIDQAVYDEWKGKAEAFKVNYIASGYATSIYNHDWSLEKLSKSKNCFLALFLYGDSDKSVMDDINKYSGFENIKIFFGVDGATFNRILSEADVYLRPNSVDSFGIAVADAVNYGVKVIASDVCKRYPGAQTFRGKEQFFHYVDVFNNSFSNEKNNIGCEDLNEKKDSFGFYMDIYLECKGEG